MRLQIVVAKASVRPGQRNRKGLLQKELFVAVGRRLAANLSTALGPLAVNLQSCTNRRAQKPARSRS
jgi:hypothetical protein